MRFLLTIGIAGALAALPSLAAPQAASQKDGGDQAGVAEAIRFERAKQAAADRQARIEAARNREENSADRTVPETKKRPRNTKATSDRKTPPEPR